MAKSIFQTADDQQAEEFQRSERIAIKEILEATHHNLLAIAENIRRNTADTDYDRHERRAHADNVDGCAEQVQEVIRRLYPR